MAAAKFLVAQHGNVEEIERIDQENGHQPDRACRRHHQDVAQGRAGYKAGGLRVCQNSLRRCEKEWIVRFTTQTGRWRSGTVMKYLLGVIGSETAKWQVQRSRQSVQADKHMAFLASPQLASYRLPHQMCAEAAVCGRRYLTIPRM
jgi:hypothetical protein